MNEQRSGGRSSIDARIDEALEAIRLSRTSPDDPDRLVGLADRVALSVAASRRSARRRLTVWLAAAAVAAGVAVPFLVRQPPPSVTAPEGRESAPAAAISATDLAGDALIDLDPTGGGPDGTIASRSGPVVLTAGRFIARVESGSLISSLRSGPERLALTLQRGMVTGHLQPGGGMAVEIGVPGGTCHVTGTVFSVAVDTSGGSVRVDEGQVLFEHADGSRLILETGDVYRVAERETVRLEAEGCRQAAERFRASPTSAEVRPITPRAGQPASISVPVALPPAATGGRPVRPAAASPGDDRDRLARVSRLMAGGRFEEALGQIGHIGAASPSDPVLAYLEAGCLHGLGRTGDASERLDRLRNRSDLPAGVRENADWLAARVAADGPAGGERRAIEAYLARWPSGLFADDARHHLCRLGGREECLAFLTATADSDRAAAVVVRLLEQESDRAGLLRLLDRVEEAAASRTVGCRALAAAGRLCMKMAGGDAGAAARFERYLDRCPEGDDAPAARAYLEATGRPAADR